MEHVQTRPVFPHLPTGSSQRPPLLSQGHSVLARAQVGEFAMVLDASLAPALVSTPSTALQSVYKVGIAWKDPGRVGPNQQHCHLGLQ